LCKAFKYGTQSGHFIGGKEWRAAIKRGDFLGDCGGPGRVGRLPGYQRDAEEERNS
jgi:hypothetical protein